MLALEDSRNWVEGYNNSDSEYFFVLYIGGDRFSVEAPSLLAVGETEGGFDPYLLKVKKAWKWPLAALDKPTSYQVAYCRRTVSGNLETIHTWTSQHINSLEEEDKKMTFREIMEMLLAGKKVRHHNWDKTSYIHLDEDGNLVNNLGERAMLGVAAECHVEYVEPAYELVSFKDAHEEFDNRPDAKWEFSTTGENWHTWDGYSVTRTHQYRYTTE